MTVIETALPQSWLALAALLVILELLFVYEAQLADASGLQRVFGVFAGLGILCFAALLYAVSSIYYGWS